MGTGIDECGAIRPHRYDAGMFQARRIIRLAAVATLGVSLLGACGGGSASANGEASKPADQILKDAQAATGSASTVHITGSIDTGGNRVQLDVVADHTRGGGVITEAGMVFDTVLLGKTVYLKADAQTWTKAANPSVARMLADKWLKTTTNNQSFNEFTTLLDISKLVSNLTSSGKLVKGSATVVDGVKVMPITDTGSDGGTLYVALTGSPYIVAVRGPTAGSGSIHFGAYNSAKVPAPPAKAIDLSGLMGG